jgi:hypothetical protein
MAGTGLHGDLGLVCYGLIGSAKIRAKSQKIRKTSLATRRYALVDFELLL